LLDLKAQYAPLKDEIRAAMDEVIESQWFIMGPNVKALEDDVATYCGAARAVGCASGSDALLLALMALGIEAGDEVICPSYTFFATGGAIHRLGAKPVFVDIDPATYNMCVEKTREAATHCTRLKAIMPVHLYGQTVDMEAYVALGKELGVPIIEDAAQAIGSHDAQGNPTGSRGTIGCFSFFPTKNLGCFGDGGIVTTNDNELADLLSILRVHGGKPKYYHKLVGVNSRLDALQAAILRVKLGHLETWHQGRRRNAAHYDGLFKAAGAMTSATPMEADGFPIRYPECPEAPSRHIYNQYCIRVPAEIRDSLRQHLTENGIGTEIYYPVPLHLQECFADLGGKLGDLPVSEACAAESLALPIYPELTEEQREHVASTVVAYVGKHAAVNA
jgi:dTDP-4-amino-4,6-dideoxygalactose transaminase